MPESVKDRHYYYDYKSILEPAAYDGRKDTTYKGSIKYDGQTISCVKGERWPNRIEARGMKTKNGNADPNIEQNHGLSIKRNDIRARNKRDVWTLATRQYKEAHFATFPEDLVSPCILAGAPENGWVLDPFCGSGTTGVVANKNNRNCILIDLKQEYVEMTKRNMFEANQQMRLNLKG